MKHSILLLAFSTFGCGTVTWVNDVTTTPDGQVVTVVGGEYSTFSKTVVRPVRWTCQRGANRQLVCAPDATPLPQPE